MLVVVEALSARFVGAAGGLVSAQTLVVTINVDTVERLPAASYASTPTE